jgi:hypothetical protein
MWAVAFGFEQGAAFQDDHADHEEQKKDTEPVYFFHSQKHFYFYKGENSPHRAHRHITF